MDKSEEIGFIGSKVTKGPKRRFEDHVIERLIGTKDEYPEDPIYNIIKELKESNGDD